MQGISSLIIKVVHGEEIEKITLGVRAKKSAPL